MSTAEPPEFDTEPPRRLRRLVVGGVVLWTLCLAVTVLSGRFEYGSPVRERPILLMLGLFAAAFAVHLWSLRVAIRAGNSRDVVQVITVFAICCRGTLLVSHPIQEIDLYRYIWDGQATAAGVSPFRYSPEQVLGASPDAANSADLERLVRLRDVSPAMRAILERIHFAELPTVYPPVSQAVFTAAAWTTPNTASVRAHVIVMKAWILAFDLATFALLVDLLLRVRRPVGWAVAYAWCPLVLKEFANSGHLDAISVCLTVLAANLAVRGWVNANPDGEREHGKRRRGPMAMATSGVVLGLAIGAKLYAIVLGPLWILVAARRHGWRCGLSIGVACLLVSGATCAPLFAFRSTEADRAAEIGPPIPGDVVSASPQAPGAGLKAFLGRWEMNDFLFALIARNLEPGDAKPERPRAWFSVIPDRWRDAITSPLTSRLEISRRNAAFLATRTLTAIAVVVLAAVFAARAARRNEPATFLEAAFLTLAWFWLLAPTQNPWYWTWAVPFLPFARGRAWLAMSGLILLYYSRFWFVYHWPDERLPFSSYAGAEFFDHVVIWAEYFPWLVWLAVDHRGCRRSTE